MGETARILPRPQDFILKFPLDEIHSADELSDDLASLFDLPSSADLPRNRSQFRPTAMDAKIREFFDAVGNFFSGGDSIPWCERDVIAGCEKEVAESDSSESKNESLMRLSWAFVHSRHTEDVNWGIAMLEDGPLQTREKVYLVAVGFYRNGNYSRSRQLLEQCLEIVPDWKQAETLKKVVENQITKDAVIGIGITAIAVGLLVCGIAVFVARRK